jgi:hypothetical protein
MKHHFHFVLDIGFDAGHRRVPVEIFAKSKRRLPTPARSAAGQCGPAHDASAIVPISRDQLSHIPRPMVPFAWGTDVERRAQSQLFASLKDGI